MWLFIRVDRILIHRLVTKQLWPQIICYATIYYIVMISDEG